MKCYRGGILLAVLLAVSSALVHPARAQEKAAKAPTEYICSMYCTDDVFTEPGKCPVCGMDLVDRYVLEHPEGYEVVSPEKAALMLKKKSQEVVVLDVRTQKEYEGATGHLEGAILIPEREIKDRMSELEPYKGKTLLVYCSHGMRSGRAAKMLNENGFKAVSLMGGTTKWKRGGYPLVKEKGDR